MGFDDDLGTASTPLAGSGSQRDDDVVTSANADNERDADDAGTIEAGEGAAESGEGGTGKGEVGELSEVERKILEVERGWWKLAPTREQAIWSELKMSETKYYLLLSRMLDSERVWRADPVLIDRLRGLREKRLAERQMPGGFGN